MQEKEKQRGCEKFSPSSEQSTFFDEALEAVNVTDVGLLFFSAPVPLPPIVHGRSKQLNLLTYI